MHEQIGVRANKGRESFRLMSGANTANEMTPNQGSSGYDAAGNMTTLQSGMTAKYDTWNRQVEVKDGEDIIQRNEYDGTNRRIQIFSDFTGATPGTTQDDYYSGQQVIESRVTVDGDPDSGYQFLWSPRYIDAPILRDTLDSNGQIVAAERIFYLADANYNVTGLVKYNSGEEKWRVAERYTYTPYGVVTYRNASWTEVDSSANGNTTLYTGRTLDLLTAFYYYRARYYAAALERFISRDPIGHKGGDINLYRYVGNNPLTHTDPTGNVGFDAPMDPTKPMWPGGPIPAKPTYGPPKTPDSICDKIKCSKCSPEDCRKLLKQIRDAAAKVPPRPGRNKCQNWAFDFEDYLRKNPIGLGKNPCVKEHGVTGFGMWFVPWAGHAAYKITLCDGSAWYVDYGRTSIGGSGSGRGVGAEIPPWIGREGKEPWQIPWWY